MDNYKYGPPAGPQEIMDRHIMNNMAKQPPYPYRPADAHYRTNTDKQQLPQRPRRGDLFDNRRRQGHPERRSKPVEDIIAELELRDERQKQQITMLHGKVNDGRTEIEKLQTRSAKDIRALRIKSSNDDKEIRSLRSQLAIRNHNSISEVVDNQAAADAHAATQDSLIRFGTNAVKEQRLRAENAESEVLHLTNTISELESSVTDLQNLIAHFEAVMAASADDYTRTCLEAQALSSVRMVKGYQNDITRMKGTIETLRCEIASRDKKLREYEKREMEESRGVEEGKREMVKERKRAETLETIAMEQERLIERLNEENGRLVVFAG